MGLEGNGAQMRQVGQAVRALAAMEATVPGQVEVSWRCSSTSMAMAATGVGGEGKNEAAAGAVGSRRSFAAAPRGRGNGQQRQWRQGGGQGCIYVEILFMIIIFYVIF